MNNVKSSLYTATFIEGPLHQQQLLVAQGQMFIEYIEVGGSIEIKHLYQAVPNSTTFKYFHK